MSSLILFFLNHQWAPCFYSWSRHNVHFSLHQSALSTRWRLWNGAFFLLFCLSQHGKLLVNMWQRANIKLVCQGVHVRTQDSVCAVADVQWWHQYIAYSILRESSINHHDLKKNMLGFWITCWENNNCGLSRCPPMICAWMRWWSMYVSDLHKQCEPPIPNSPPYSTVGINTMYVECWRIGS